MSRISDKAKRGLEWLGFRVTGSRWAWTAVIGTVALWASTQGPIPKGNPLPTPLPVPQIELQNTANARVPWTLARLALTKLPPAIDAQHKKPCELDMEREINGACWIPLDLHPCPKGKAWVNDGEGGDGKCYARSMKFPIPPTSGDPDAPSGVAAPE